MEEPRLREFGDCDAVLGPGVYALFLYGECVYIGKAKRVLHRLYAHKNLWERLRQRKTLPRSGPLSGVRAIRFNGVGVYPCKEVDLDWVERAMIEKYRPKHNIQLKPEGQVTLAKAGFDFTALLRDRTQAEQPKLLRRV